MLIEKTAISGGFYVVLNTRKNVSFCLVGLNADLNFHAYPVDSGTHYG